MGNGNERARAVDPAWLGDPAAEAPARDVIRALEPSGGERWPRRVASARLDLALALIAAGRPDEASAEAVRALESGRIVASNR